MRAVLWSLDLVKVGACLVMLSSGMSDSGLGSFRCLSLSLMRWSFGIGWERRNVYSECYQHHAQDDHVEYISDQTCPRFGISLGPDSEGTTFPKLNFPLKARATTFLTSAIAAAS